MVSRMECRPRPHHLNYSRLLLTLSLFALHEIYCFQFSSPRDYVHHRLARTRTIDFCLTAVHHDSQLYDSFNLLRISVTAEKGPSGGTPEKRASFIREIDLFFASNKNLGRNDTAHTMEKCGRSAIT